MWIEAESGKLVNLEHATQITTTKLDGTTTFMAYFPTSTDTEAVQDRAVVDLVTAHSDAEVEQVRSNLRSIVQAQALTVGRFRRTVV